METSNPLSMSGHIAMIQTLIYENKQRRRKAMLTESEKAQGSETNPYIFVGQPKTYILKNECEHCGQNKTWCLCSIVSKR